MEMLIVVAIIAILVTIALPSITKQMHKVKVTADVANVRAYYAEMEANYVETGEYDPSIGDDMWQGVTDTLHFPDGQEVKLQAGWVSVIRPPDNALGTFGYQVHYFCKDGGKCTYTFGAQN